MSGLVVDLFCGAGGASEGIRQATGRSPDIVVDLDDLALEVHQVNHPKARHLCCDVTDPRVLAAVGGQPVELLWLSPPCTHFSRARSGRPVSAEVRGLPHVAVTWAVAVRPRIILLENVQGMLKWGPLDDQGRPIRSREGEDHRAFVAALQAAGYTVDWRRLRAAEYGAPTIRRRLFLVARRDGEPRWPEPTHGPGKTPYRAAGECIDWSIPCRPVYGRARPLAAKTIARIEEGYRRFVVEAERPYLVDLEHGRVVAYGIQTRNSERPGQAPRTLDLRAPLNTITAGSSPGAVVVAPRRGSAAVAAAYGVLHYSSGGQWQDLDAPLTSVTTRSRGALVTAAGDPPDLRMRMLQPHELAAAQGFPPDYVFLGSKARRTKNIGNSVSPPVARALVAANSS